MRPLILCTTLAAFAYCTASALTCWIIPPGSASTAPRVRSHTQRDEPALLCGNMFDGSGSLCGAAREPERPTELAPCEGPRLVGIVRGALESQALFAGVGVVALGGMVGPHLLSEVGADRTILSRDGVRCERRLFADPPIDETNDAASERRTGARTPLAVVGDRVQLPRSLLRDLVAQPRSLGALQVVPRPDGFQLYGLRRGSLLERAGLRNGDILLTIQGRAISPDLGLELLSQLPTLSRLSLTLLRGSEHIELNADVID